MEDLPVSRLPGAIHYEPQDNAFVPQGMAPGLERKRLTRIERGAARTVTWVVVSARLREVLEATGRHPGEWQTLTPHAGG